MAAAAHPSAGGDPPTGRGRSVARRRASALRRLLQLTARSGESAQTGADREITTAEDLSILRRYLPDFDNTPLTNIAPEKDGDHK
jgi:hypothetical protein